MMRYFKTIFLAIVIVAVASPVFAAGMGESQGRDLDALWAAAQENFDTETEELKSSVSFRTRLSSRQPSPSFMLGRTEPMAAATSERESTPLPGRTEEGSMPFTSHCSITRQCFSRPVRSSQVYKSSTVYRFVLTSAVQSPCSRRSFTVGWVRSSLCVPGITAARSSERGGFHGPIPEA